MCVVCMCLCVCVCVCVQMCVVCVCTNVCGVCVCVCVCVCVSQGYYPSYISTYICSPVQPTYVLKASGSAFYTGFSRLEVHEQAPNGIALFMYLSLPKQGKDMGQNEIKNFGVDIRVVLTAYQQCILVVTS